MVPRRRWLRTLRRADRVVCCCDRVTGHDGNPVSRRMGHTKSTVTHATYSLFVFVYRSSGSFPRRPMRRSFAISAEREALVENACNSGVR